MIAYRFFINTSVFKTAQEAAPDHLPCWYPARESNPAVSLCKSDGFTSCAHRAINFLRHAGIEPASPTTTGWYSTSELMPYLYKIYILMIGGPPRARPWRKTAAKYQFASIMRPNKCIIHASTTKSSGAGSENQTANKHWQCFRLSLHHTRYITLSPVLGRD